MLDNRISVSQIAWNESNQEEHLELLKKFYINKIEIAPGLLFNNPSSVDPDEVKNIKLAWKRKGFQFVAMQGILYGRNDLQLFSRSNKSFISYLTNIIDLASRLGVKIIVFGCPKNRSINKNYSIKDSYEIFYKLGSLAGDKNVFFCIEPNAVDYGTNFINTVDEAIKVVKDVNNPHFKMILDTSTIILNKGNIIHSIEKAKNHFIHFHISAPMLEPIYRLNINHKKVAEQLKKINYNGLISIEMVHSKNQMGVKGFKKCLEPILENYNF